MDELQIGDKVELIIGRPTKIGFTVMVDEEFEGMLYKNELFQRIEEGQKLVGYVKNVREDGKLDVSLKPIGFKKALVTDEIFILNELKKKEGFLPFNDKSSPDDIKYGLQMSKKSFKKAIGGLYKQKLINIEEDGIHLIKYD